MRDSGEQYVIISGGPAMLKWHADNLDSLLMVTYQNRMVHFIFSFCGNVFFFFFSEHNRTPSGKKTVTGVQVITAYQVQSIGCRWQVPVTALSRSARGTHFQVVSKGTKFD